MNKEIEKYFDKAISILNKLGIKNEDIIVTGSVALDILGVLPDNHKIHDFDCIIKLNPEKVGMFKLMCEIFKSDKCPSCIADNARLIEVDDIVLNIWWNEPNETATVSYKGVGVKNILGILAKKKKYNRDKDCRDINEIVKMVLI